MPDFKKLLALVHKKHGDLEPPPAQGPFEHVVWDALHDPATQEFAAEAERRILEITMQQVRRTTSLNGR